jgi:hypothetical protein
MLYNQQAPMLLPPPIGWGEGAIVCSVSHGFPNMNSYRTVKASQTSLFPLPC